MQPYTEMPPFDSSQQFFLDPQFDPNPTTHDDFLDQIFSGVPSSSAAADLESLWDPLSYTAADDYPINAAEYFHYDNDDLLASKLRHHQINGAASPPEIINPLHHDQMVNIAGLLQPTEFLNHQGGDEALFNGGFNYGADTTTDQNLHHLSGAAPNFVAPASVMNLQAAEQQLSGSTGGAGVAPAQLKQRVRARRGQATDPHSIAERLRRERIAERMKGLQELVPNANKTDKASMLDEIINYVKFLQLQVKVQSMSAAAVAPLVPDMCPKTEGGGDCHQRSHNVNGNNLTGLSNDSLTVTEHQVAKLMEEDMGSAIQYLQDKGLCLMPVSLASAISAANTTSSVAPVPLQISGVEGSSSPSMSDLTGNSGGYDGSIKDTTSIRSLDNGVVN